MKHLNWIQPNRPKREVIRCEYCGANVSGPYKGIHDETEMINGIPVKCRNNGRLNIFIAYPESAKQNECAKDGFFWLVEHNETNLWWTGFKWTNDVNEAFQCNTERAADRYARFQKLENYTVTEHQLIDKE